MTTTRVRLEDFGKVLEEFSYKQISQIKQGVASGVARSIPDLVKASPVDTGLYAQSWDFTADEHKVILGNYAPHAPIIEVGARPFHAPIKPLLEWAKRVLKDSSQPPEYSEEVRALAYATQKKIANLGIAPKHVLEDMLPRILENIKQELKNA